MKRRRPGHRLDLLKQLPDFKEWLEDRGAEIQETGPNELLRFKTLSDVAVIYCNGHGYVTRWDGPAADAWNAFVTGGSWSAGKPIGRVDGSRRRKVVAFLMERDGPGCVYCDTELDLLTATIEHLVPLSAGGRNHADNLALACDPCNQKAADLAPAQKIRLAIERRESIRVAKQKAAQ
jgi:hypothetical protein